MTKRSTRSDSNTGKEPARSPNRRDKKHSKADSAAATTDSNGPKLVEDHMNDLNLIGTLHPSIAIAKPGDVCGGRHLWSNLVSPLKDTWHTIDKLIKDSLLPYTMLDKWKEGEGLHDLASGGKNLRRVSGQGKVLTAEGWRLLFQELYQETSDLAKSTRGSKLRIFGLRLAKTPPKTIFEGADWVTHEGETVGLQSGLLTDAWTGAYIYFGAYWKQEDRFQDYLAPPGKMKAKPSLKPHSFFDAGKAMKHTQEKASHDLDEDPIDLSNDDPMEGNTEEPAEEASDSAKGPATPAPPGKKCAFARQLYIRKERNKIDPLLQQKKKKWNESRKFSSFLKIRTAKLKSDDRLGQEDEFLAVMQETLTKLWTLDPKLVIFPWKKGLEGSKPIQKGKAFPSNRDAFADFTEKVFLKRGENVWIRLHVGHNKQVTALKDDRMIDHFRQKDMLVYKDNLQVKTTAKAGWLLGSHPTVLNARDLEDSLAQLPEMSGLPVEVRTEWISLDKGDKLKIKAAHILCAWDSTLVCRRALNKIYGKKMGEYPLGRNMRFVPNISDKRFITTEATRKKVEMSVKKQRLWITHVSSAVSYIISDLDYFDTTIGTTLRQALMQMRSKRSPDRNLFVAVDTSWNGSFVSFLFKKDLESEVNGILPALPLVLQHKMGANVWNWFNEEARTNTNGYWWCPRKGVRAVGDDDEDSWGDSLESDDDAGYWSSTSGASGVSRASSATNGVFVEPFDITAGAGKNEYDEGDDQSVGAWSTVTKGNDGMGPGTAKATGHSANSTASIDTSTTSPMSTLSPGGSADSEYAQEALLSRMRSDPIYAQELMRQFTASFPQASFPPSFLPPNSRPIFPPHNPAFGESLMRQFSSSALPKPLVPPAALGTQPASTPPFASAAPPPASSPAVAPESPPTNDGEGSGN